MHPELSRQFALDRIVGFRRDAEHHRLAREASVNSRQPVRTAIQLRLSACRDELERLGGGVGIHRDRVVGEEKLPDGLPHGECVGVLLLGRLDEIADETLVGKPHRELVRRRDPVDAGLEVQRVDVVADEVELRM